MFRLVEAGQRESHRDEQCNNQREEDADSGILIEVDEPQHAQTDKLHASEQRDRSLRVQIQPLWDQYKNAIKKEPQLKDRLREYRWQIEEFRISLFAQDPGTEKPVSAKRLAKLWQELTS